MNLIVMAEAARRLGLSRSDVAKRLLERQGVAIHSLSERAHVVDAEDVERLARARRDSGYSGRGRPYPGNAWTSPARQKQHNTEVAA